MFTDGDIYLEPSNIPREIVKYSLKCTALGFNDYAKEYFAEGFDYSNLAFSADKTYEAGVVLDSVAEQNGYYGLNYADYEQAKIVEVKRRKNSYDENYTYEYDEIYYFLLTAEGDISIWNPWLITDYVYYSHS